MILNSEQRKLVKTTFEKFCGLQNPYPTVFFTYSSRESERLLKQISREVADHLLAASDLVRILNTLLGDSQ